MESGFGHGAGHTHRLCAGRWPLVPCPPGTGLLRIGARHPALVAARRVTPKWTFLYGGALLAGWDLFLDPQMVAAGRWTWEVTGSHIPFVPDVPLSNFFGWLLAGCAITALLNLVLPFERRKESASLRAVTLLLAWVLFSGFIGNLFFFDRPGLAFFATAVMGGLLTPYFFSSWLGSKE